MNKYTKSFLHRGLIFGGFGPLVVAIVFYVLSLTLPAFTLTGDQVFLAVVSTYLLAFVHAGASVFHQIEHWPLTKSLLWNFGALYLAYAACYLVNSWIPFEPLVLVIFTGIFVVTYFLVWGIVYLCVRSASRKMNEKI